MAWHAMACQAMPSRAKPCQGKPCQAIGMLSHTMPCPVQSFLFSDVISSSGIHLYTSKSLTWLSSPNHESHLSE